MERPRYRCAVEVGFLPPPGEAVAIAKFGGKVADSCRVEIDDTFDFDGIPGKWMEPLNDVAMAKCEELVALKKRKSVEATSVASTEPLVAPRSGMAGSAVMPILVRDVATDARDPAPAPRRRAAARA